MRWAARIDRVRATVAVALAASAVASLSLPVAGRAAVADADCAGPVDNVAANGNHTERFAQTFSPINGGYLTAVRLFVDEQAHGSNYLIQITPVNSSDLVPVNPGVVMAEATIADSSIAISPVSHGTEVEADFPTPPAVVASSEYAIVVKRPGDQLGVGIRSGGGHDPCPDGGFYTSPDDSTPWSGPLMNDDMVFTTYVDGPPSPTTTPTTTTTLPASPQPPLVPPATCKVPKLIGKTLKGAKRKIRSSNCTLGKVTKKEGATAKTGKVARQNPQPGKILAAGTKIGVTLD
jgi:hypothetical protein